MRQRISYYDLARGLAILLVIFYHVPLYIRICHPCAAELLTPHINAGTYILPFFMPVFFIISGCFTNTDKNYGQFLWSDVKHLLLAGLLLSFVNVAIQSVGLRDIGAVQWFVKTLFSIHFMDLILANWFISAIFFSRQIFYAVDHVSRTISKERKGLYWSLLFGMLACFAIIGILVEPYAPHNNQWFYCQGLVFAVFIAFGRLMKEYPLNKWWLSGIGIGYVLLMLVARRAGISTLEYGMVNTSFTLAHWPFYMLLALTGSALLIALAQIINRFAPLEFIGRHSLIFYIPQGGVLLVTATLLGRWFLPNKNMHVWLYILILWLSALLVLSVLSFLRDTIHSAYTRISSKNL